MHPQGDKATGRRLVLLVLGVLCQSPLHGYGIVRKIEEASRGAFSPGEGLVYPLLHEMERIGLVQARWEQADGRCRKVYSVTDMGSKRFKEELRTWESETNAVLQVLSRKEEPGLALG